MKRFLSILLLGLAASAAHAQVDWPIVLQLKYSPLGIIDADEDSDAPRPGHIKDRVRALGPTVRPDLTLKPHDASAIDKVV